MAKYIELDALLAEIERLENQNCKNSNDFNLGAATYLGILKKSIDTLEVKEVDLEKELEEWIKYGPHTSYPWCTIPGAIKITAKHFFELGMAVNNPTTAADRGTAEEIIINLKRVEKDYRIDLTREIEWLRNKVKKGEQ